MQVAEEIFDAGLAWFIEFQQSRVIRNGVVPEWFHGFISRTSSEEVLMRKPVGYFLIRVSQSRVGYTLSYRGEDQCRHFMIDVLQNGQYNIVGESTVHMSLQDLVEFHRRVPILPFNDVLTVACRKSVGQTSVLAHATLNPPSSNTVKIDKPLPLPKKRLSLVNPDVPDSKAPELPARSFPPQNRQQTMAEPNRLPGPSLVCPEKPLSQTTMHCGSTAADPIKKKGVKTAVVNLINFKKKQAKNVSAEEPLYAELAMEPETLPVEPTFSALEQGNVKTTSDNVYQEMPGESQFPEQNVTSVHNSVAGTISFDSVLPAEYLPQPPFAPGY